LSSLEERADALQDGSAQFEKRAASLKNKFWLENLKSMIAMGAVGLILLMVIYFNFIKEKQSGIDAATLAAIANAQKNAGGGGGHTGGDTGGDSGGGEGGE